MYKNYLPFYIHAVNNPIFKKYPIVEKLKADQNKLKDISYLQIR